MIIAGALLLGLGLGVIFGYEGPGVLIGLGLGLLIQGAKSRSGKFSGMGNKKEE